jgi:TatD DNase family protein
MLIDSHCHLDYFSEAERPDVIARAKAAGVGQMVTIGVTLSQSHKAIAMAEEDPDVWCSVGVHPNHAADEGPVPAPAVIAAMTAHRKVIGIGESGLDYFYDKAPKDVQAENFRAHIRAAQLTGLPLAIHARDADADVARILAEERDAGGEFLFLLHCFSSGRGLAEAAVAMGGYISFSGILTFPKSNELREIAADMPLERLLVETDSPYLAPVPFRGKRNEPGHTVHTAKVLGEVRGLSPAAVAELTTGNFRKLYRKAAARGVGGVAARQNES